MSIFMTFVTLNLLLISLSSTLRTTNYVLQGHHALPGDDYLVVHEASKQAVPCHVHIDRLEFSKLCLHLAWKHGHNQVHFKQAVQGGKLTNLVKVSCQVFEFLLQLHKLLMITPLTKFHLFELSNHHYSRHVRPAIFVIQISPSICQTLEGLQDHLQVPCHHGPLHPIQLVHLSSTTWMDHFSPLLLPGCISANISTENWRF